MRGQRGAQDRGGRDREGAVTAGERCLADVERGANELAGIAEDFVTNCAGTDAGMIEYDVASMNRSLQRLLLQLN